MRVMSIETINECHVVARLSQNPGNGEQPQGLDP
jgi:hypothetical protein